MSANMESCTRFIGMMSGGGTVQLTLEPRLRLSNPPFPWDLGLQVSKSLLFGNTRWIYSCRTDSTDKRAENYSLTVVCCAR